MAEASDVTPVTGQTVFWALIAVALTASTQRSYTSEAADSALKTIDLPIVAYRSSPIVCFSDSLHEIFDIIRFLCSTPVLEAQASSAEVEDTQSASNTTSNGEVTNSEMIASETAVMCLQAALFVLGAVPQEIKLFACQGIPVAQVLAAIYLTAIVIHVAHYIVVVRLMGSRTHKMVSLANDEMLSFGSLILHSTFYILLWPEIVVTTVFWLTTLDQNMSKIMHWASVMVNSFATIVFLVNIILAFVYGSHVPAWELYATHAGLSLGEVLHAATDKTQTQAAQDAVGPLVAGLPVPRLMTYKSIILAYSVAVTLPAVVCILLTAGSFRLADSLLRMPDATQASLSTPAVDAPLPGVLTGPQAANTAHNSIFARIQGLWSQLQPPLAKMSWREYTSNVLAGLGLVLQRTCTPYPLTGVATRWMLTFEPAVRYSAFLLMNVSTAALYFTIIFDGTGTVNPGWTGVFG